MTVKDNGVGLSTNPPKAPGMGLRIMHYRARVIGASLSVESSKADGTTLRCVFVPLLRDSKNGGHNGAQMMSNGSEQTYPAHAARA